MRTHAFTSMGACTRTRTCTCAGAVAVRRAKAKLKAFWRTCMCVRVHERLAGVSNQVFECTPEIWCACISQLHVYANACVGIARDARAAKCAYMCECASACGNAFVGSCESASSRMHVCSCRTCMCISQHPCHVLMGMGFSAASSHICTRIDAYRSHAESYA